MNEPLDPTTRAVLARPRSNFVLVVVVGLLFAAVAAIVSAALPPVYSTTARLLVGASRPDPPTFEQVQADEAYARTYVQLMSSRVVAERVVSKLSFTITVSQARGAMSFVALNDTPLIEVTAEADSPERAQELANRWARTFVEDGPTLLSGTPDPVALSDPAPAPAAPVRPRPLLYTALAGFVGLVAGAALAAARRGRRTESAEPTGDEPPPAQILYESQPLSRTDDLLRLRLLLFRRWLLGLGGICVGAAAGVVIALLVSAPTALGLLVAANAGAGVGVVLVAAALLLNNRIRDPLLLPGDAARATGAPIVVQVSRPRRALTAESTEAVRDLEPYRVLLSFLGPDLPSVVLVTGIRAETLGGVAARDLAAVSAAAGHRTVLVGNLGERERPVVDLLRRIEDDTAAAIEDELIATDHEDLWILAASWPASSDTDGRGAIRLRALRLLSNQLGSVADVVVIAGPSTEDTSLTMQLADVADGAVLVLPAGQVSAHHCANAVVTLRSARCPVLGVVLAHRSRGTAGQQIFFDTAGGRPEPAHDQHRRVPERQQARRGPGNGNSGTRGDGGIKGS